jgi:hypothetical protein
VRQVQPLQKMRSVISTDGRLAQFFLLFRGGQHTAFSVPHHKMGLFIQAVKGVVKTMQGRLAKFPEANAAETMAGLADPAPVCGVVSGTDATTGDTLLQLETTDSGTFSFQLDQSAKETLAATLQDLPDPSVPEHGPSPKIYDDAAS